MRSSEVVAGILVLLVVAQGIFIGIWTNRKRARLAPRDRRRFDRKQLVISTIIIIGGALLMFSEDQLFYAAMYCLVVLAIGYPIISQQMTYSDVDARLNYADDPGRCGRCDYDLTGNVSGVCPECSWQIPETPDFTEPPHWAYWWKSWHIEHIENWRRTLAGCTFGVLLIAGYTVFAVAWLRHGWFVVFFMAAILVNYLILVWRLIAYVRRQRGQ